MSDGARLRDASASGTPDHREDGRVLVKRGLLELVYDPLEVWYGSDRLPLSPLESRIMEALMRRGRASWETIDHVLRDGASSETVRDVLIYRMRRKLAAIGAPDVIETVRGWGLKLRVGPVRSPSAGLLIGGRSRSF